MTVRPHIRAAVRRVTSGGAVVTAAVLLVLATLFAVAAVGDPAPATTAQRAQSIASGLRCPVCGDLSAADSPAPLAGQMRHQITDMVAQGRTAAQIRAHFVAAYGDSVLMAPPRRGMGLVAYLLPVVVTGAAVMAGGLLLRRWRRAAASAAGRQDSQLAAPTGPVRPRHRPAAQGPVARRPAQRLQLGLVVATVLAVGVGTLLGGSVSARTPGQTVSGDQADTIPGGTTAPPSGSGPGASQPTAEQVAAVNAAVAVVRRRPRNPASHLDLARAYAAAGQSQLSTIEYLAVTRLDPANAEAHTALAMVAFLARQPQEAKQLADTALDAHPRYPEALYTRGLVQLMGLKEPAAAERDLRAYLDAAPYGAHRATVETLLAMIPEGTTP